jgi:hypothetical protein
MEKLDGVILVLEEMSCSLSSSSYALSHSLYRHTRPQHYHFSLNGQLAPFLCVELKGRQAM